MKEKIKTFVYLAGIVALFAIAWIAYSHFKTQIVPVSESQIGALSATREDEKKEEAVKEKEEEEEDVLAPDFAFYTAEGKSVQLSSLRGKPVVLNFWASWCYYCGQMLPNMQQAYAELGDKAEFVMLNVTDGIKETQKSAENYLQKHDYTFPVYFDLDQAGKDNYDVYSLPTTFIIDQDGNIRAYAKSVITAQTLIDAINALAEKKDQ